MGGGTDVDEAFQWMIKGSGGGNFVIIRTSGSNGYNSYIYDFGGIQSVATLAITSIQGANDPFVVSQINGAEALFIAGGDQSTYVRLWNNTAVRTQLQALINRGAPVGGTSAGMAVLSQFIYTALLNSATSDGALKDPYNPDVTLGSHFLDISVLKNVVTDTHFYQRDRMGRSLAFLARLIQDRMSPVGTFPFGIAADEQTGVLIDQTGLGTVVSRVRNHVYFIKSTKAPTVCEQGIPLSISSLSVHRSASGETFNLVNWSGTGGIDYTLNVEQGVVTSSKGSIY